MTALRIRGKIWMTLLDTTSCLFPQLRLFFSQVLSPFAAERCFLLRHVRAAEVNKWITDLYNITVVVRRKSDGVKN